MDNSKYSISLDGAVWRTSSYTNGNGNCVELAALPEGHVGVRDTKDPDGRVLVFTRAEIVALVQGVQDGEFNDLI